MCVPASRSTTAHASPTGTCVASAPGSCSSRVSSIRTSRPASARSRSLPAFTARALGESLAGRRAPLKAALLDQRTLAGLGNIYVDEALWYARLQPAAGGAGARGGRAAAPAPRDPQGARARHRTPGLDAQHLPAARRLLRLDAARVPRLRTNGGAVRPLRHGAREDPCRRPQHLVLPPLPALGGFWPPRPRASRRARPSCPGARAPCSRRSAARRSGSAGPTSRP